VIDYLLIFIIQLNFRPISRLILFHILFCYFL